MNGLGSNYNLSNNRMGIGASAPLKNLPEKQPVQPNFNNIGADIALTPQVAPMQTSFGLTFNRKQIEKEDKSKNGKLDLSEIGKNLFKGVAGFAIEVIKHPVKSIAVAAGIGILTTLCPPLGGIMIAGAAMGGAFSLGGGILKAGISLAKKDWDGFEKSFEDTGSGISTMIMSGFMARSFNKLTGGKPQTAFKLSPEGIGQWAKDSYSLVKKIGTENYRSAFNLVRANLQGAFETIKAPKGENLINTFTNLRKEALIKMNSAPLEKLSIPEIEKPVGFFDKIRFNLAKDKSKFIGEIKDRADIDLKSLQQSTELIKSIPEALKNSWTYLPDTDKSVKPSPKPLNLQM